MADDDTIVVTAEDIAAAAQSRESGIGNRPPPVGGVPPTAGESGTTLPVVSAAPVAPTSTLAVSLPAPVSRPTVELTPATPVEPVLPVSQAPEKNPLGAEITSTPSTPSSPPPSLGGGNTAARLPGDDRVQQALRAVSTPAPAPSMFGSVTDALKKATERAKQNADESVLTEHAPSMGAFSAKAVDSKQQTVNSTPGLSVMPKAPAAEDDGTERSPKPTNANVLRTLQADSAEFIRTNKVSMTTVALKEAAKQRTEETETSHNTRRTIILVSLSLLLLVGGGGAMLFVFIYNAPPQPAAPLSTTGTGIATLSFDPIIFTENKKQINLANEKGKNAAQVLTREVGNANDKLGSMKAIFLANGDGVGSLLSASDVLGSVARRVPPRLVRQIDPAYTFGLLVGATNEGFLILTTENYDTVFADMLAWESDLVRDMYAPFTGKEASKELLETAWKDAVVRNIDVRELEAPDEDDALIWGFVNQKTLVLARNEATFKEVLTRLTTPKPVSR